MYLYMLVFLCVYMYRLLSSKDGVFGRILVRLLWVFVDKIVVNYNELDLFCFLTQRIFLAFAIVFKGQ